MPCSYELEMAYEDDKTNRIQIRILCNKKIQNQKERYAHCTVYRYSILCFHSKRSNPTDHRAASERRQDGREKGERKMKKKKLYIGMLFLMRKMKS